jgi:hypothetical protein
VEKVVYVAIRADATAAPSASTILSDARDVFADGRYRAVSVQLPRRDVEEERDRIRGGVLSQMSGGQARPEPRRLVALLTLWVDSADELGAAEGFLNEYADDVTGYVVTETVARWQATADGPPDGGVNAVSLLHRNPAMTREQFLQHWARVHMPISLRYHPQWRYVRNPVVRTLAGDSSRAPDAIAEEGFATPQDLIDPMRFYGVEDGTAETLAINKKIVFDDVPVFLDVASTATFVTEEHVIRTAWTPYAISAAEPVGGKTR